MILIKLRAFRPRRPRGLDQGAFIENSLWAVTFLLIAAALLRLWIAFHGLVRFAIGSAIAGIAGYLALMLTVDGPMYFDRWHADVAAGKQPLGVFAGLLDVSTRWTVTHDIAQWGDEIAWMSLYFSVAVWSSLALCSFGFIRGQLLQYCTRAQVSHPASRHPYAPVGAGRAQ